MADQSSSPSENNAPAPAPKKGGGGGGKAKKGGAVDLKSIPPAPFIEPRNALFDKLYALQQEKYVSLEKDVTVKLLDGVTEKPVRTYVTTPYDIAKSISSQMAEKVIVARLTYPDGEEKLWDMGRPLDETCAGAAIEFLDWEYDEAKQVFWHSSAHILGRALERLLGSNLVYGPPLPEGGCFYDADTGGRALTDQDYKGIEDAMNELIAMKAPFTRLEINRTDILSMFEYNGFKSTILKNKVKSETGASVYRSGDLIDPCRGPHVRHTGLIKGVAITKHGSSEFLGMEGNPTMQRIYAIAFPSQKLLTEWKEKAAAAEGRDHRKIGVAQELFKVGHKMAPGMTFWFPHGTRIYNKLMEWMRSEQKTRGFEEVISPNMFKSDLWKTSGHWDKYEDCMFTLKVENEMHGLKPMNCPGHCLMFGNRARSYRELPLRFADYGVLHRNERSGTLSGLTRVRRFCQDDAHIFCMESQVTSEVENALLFVEHIYKCVGMSVEYRLATRPESTARLGDDALWDRAENALAAALSRFCGIPATALPDPFRGDSSFVYDGSERNYHKVRRLIETKKWPAGVEVPKHLWRRNEGDGAFYGPKVDMSVQDALGRHWQCATLQLDYNLPERFELKYQLPEADAQDGEQWVRPVMIHRAIFGSLERFIAILTEHYGGLWPFWLSPRQAMVVPVAATFNDYAQKVAAKLGDYFVDADLGNSQLAKKVRDAQQARYNFILVVGAEEETAQSVNIRHRDGRQLGTKTLEEALAWFGQLTQDKDCSF